MRYNVRKFDGKENEDVPQQPMQPMQPSSSHQPHQPLHPRPQQPLQPSSSHQSQQPLHPRPQQQTQEMTQADLRKIQKPLVERKRRERINNCLDELKSILVETDPRLMHRSTKLEKAEILELTVQRLRTMTNRRQPPSCTVTMATSRQPFQMDSTGYDDDNDTFGNNDNTAMSNSSILPNIGVFRDSPFPGHSPFDMTSHVPTMTSAVDRRLSNSRSNNNDIINNNNNQFAPLHIQIPRADGSLAPVYPRNPQAGNDRNQNGRPEAVWRPW